MHFKEWKNRKESEDMEISYVVVSPGGNDTALINGLIFDAQLRNQINYNIMTENPNVEQVGFYEYSSEYPVLQMAGGEFCGNALRSYAFLLLKGKTGELLFEVSGVKQMLKSGIDKDGNIFAEMPILNGNVVKSIQTDMFRVDLEGISHIIVPTTNYASPSERKIEAFKILTELNLTKLIPAAGVMFVNTTNDQLSVDPVVWVRDIKTLFFETACASGTIAVGIWLAERNNLLNQSISVLQPSGKFLQTQIIKIDSVTRAIISGPDVSLLRESTLMKI